MIRPDLGSWWIGAAVVGALVVGAAAALISVNRPTWEAREIVAVEGARVSAELSVTVAHNRCRSDPRIRVAESEDGVRVRAEQDVSGGCEDILLESTSGISLDGPVGPRAVLVEDVPGRPGSVRCAADDDGSIICR